MEPTPSSPLPSSQIDRNIVKLAQAVEAAYGGFWTIVWRNFLAGFMRVLGMLFAYVLILGGLVFFLLKTGLAGQIQTFYQNFTRDFITDFQKNLNKSLPQIPELNQIPQIPSAPFNQNLLLTPSPPPKQ